MPSTRLPIDGLWLSRQKQPDARCRQAEVASGDRAVTLTEPSRIRSGRFGRFAAEPIKPGFVGHLERPMSLKSSATLIAGARFSATRLTDLPWSGSPGHSHRTHMGARF